jgi:hypothetical protein
VNELGMAGPAIEHSDRLVAADRADWLEVSKFLKVFHFCFFESSNGR